MLDPFGIDHDMEGAKVARVTGQVLGGPGEDLVQDFVVAQLEFRQGGIDEPDAFRAQGNKRCVIVVRGTSTRFPAVGFFFFLLVFFFIIVFETHVGKQVALALLTSPLKRNHTGARVAAVIGGGIKAARQTQRLGGLGNDTAVVFFDGTFGFLFFFVFVELEFA